MINFATIPQGQQDPSPAPVGPHTIATARHDNQIVERLLRGASSEDLLETRRQLEKLLAATPKKRAPSWNCSSRASPTSCVSVCRSRSERAT